MRSVIHAKDFPLTEAIRAHLMRRINTSFGRFEDRITSVEVYFKDLNGSTRGGVDKKVLLRIELRGMEPVVVEHTSDDLYHAISAAARRAKKSVKRTLRRHQRIDRRNLRQLPFDSPAASLMLTFESGSQRGIG